MPTDRWRRVEEMFAEAARLPAAGRGDFLAGLGGSDAEMRDEIASLLAALESSNDFLAAPALDLLADQVSREGWTVRTGDRIGVYTVGRRLGAGGMGEVWRARDERLGRDVAIKLLLPHPSTAGRVRALDNEARAAGALNHTNVLTVHDVGEHQGAPYIVTECLEGEPLRARLRAGALAVDEALDVAIQVARGLAAAHGKGIVHRDLKPENVFLGLDGRVKILDFGLATLRDPLPESSPGRAAETALALIAGTAGYMAPEQVRGAEVDERADIFALGAVLYEMLAGRRAFKGDSTLRTMEAVLTLEPEPLSALVPGALSEVVRRCLAKSPSDRFATAAALESALGTVIRERSSPSPPGVLALFRRPAAMAAAALLILAAALGVWRWRAVASRERWARTIAAPEIERLSNRSEYVEAFLLAREALDVLPDDPHLRRLMFDASVPARVTTDPAGAHVSFAAYRDPRTWVPLGVTPLVGIRDPRCLIRIRIEKAGFEPIEATTSPAGMRFRLDPTGEVPPGMVRVSGGRNSLHFGGSSSVGDFWFDRFEVTNRQYKSFVDQGGYRRREYWREPFVRGGKPVTWETAMAELRDATGLPGPATWSSGTYPQGRAEFPVEGVSWYEASAYAAFAGKSLPTIYHWRRAADLGRFADILTLSNFSGKGPAPVGSYKGLGPFGTYDMAGNVKEWCSNQTGDRHFLLGGAWNEPRYMFGDFDARGAFERAPGYGFRLAQYITPPPPDDTAPVSTERLFGAARRRRPVSDEVFAVYRRQHAYDHVPLNAAVEATEQTESGIEQTVSIDVVDGERMHAHLFLPRDGRPPYQTVVFFPAADAFNLRSDRDISSARAEFIIRSGRALFCPVFKGTYDRPQTEGGESGDRALRITWTRDLGRAIDYLETRSDIDRSRIALYGVSSGGDAGVLLAALEPRLRTCILQGTGINDDESAPETDAVNYAPRVRIPALMLNGRYDFEQPFALAQQPLFELLGSPAGDKRHAVFEMGHALPIADVAGVIVPWLDRYLGPVNRQ